MNIDKLKQELETFNKNKDYFFTIKGSGPNEEVVAEKRNWLGRIWVFICNLFGAGNASLVKVVNIVLKTLKAEKNLAPDSIPGLDKLQGKVKNYNKDHSNKLALQYKEICSLLSTQKNNQTDASPSSPKDKTGQQSDKSSPKNNDKSSIEKDKNQTDDSSDATDDKVQKQKDESVEKDTADKTDAKPADSKPTDESQKKKDESVEKDVADKAAEAAKKAKDDAEAAKKAKDDADAAEATKKAKDDAEAAEAAKKAKDDAEAAEIAKKAKEDADAVEAAKKAKDEAEAAEAAKKAKDEAEAAEIAKKAKEDADAVEAAKKAKEDAEAAEAAKKAKDDAEAAEAAKKAKDEAEAAEAAKKAKEDADAAAKADTKPADSKPNAALLEEFHKVRGKIRDLVIFWTKGLCESNDAKPEVFSIIPELNDQEIAKFCAYKDNKFFIHDHYISGSPDKRMEWLFKSMSKEQFKTLIKGSLTENTKGILFGRFLNCINSKVKIDDQKEWIAFITEQLNEAFKMALEDETKKIKTVSEYLSGLDPFSKNSDDNTIIRFGMILIENYLEMDKKDLIDSLTLMRVKAPICMTKSMKLFFETATEEQKKKIGNWRNQNFKNRAICKGLVFPTVE